MPPSQGGKANILLDFKHSNRPTVTSHLEKFDLDFVPVFPHEELEVGDHPVLVARLAAHQELDADTSFYNR